MIREVTQANKTLTEEYEAAKKVHESRRSEFDELTIELQESRGKYEQLQVSRIDDVNQRGFVATKKTTGV